MHYSEQCTSSEEGRKELGSLGGDAKELTKLAEYLGASRSMSPVPSTHMKGLAWDPSAGEAEAVSCRVPPPRPPTPGLSGLA